jgi:hypothetical protein
MISSWGQPAAGVPDGQCIQYGTGMATLDDVASMALGLPEVTESERHGNRTWYVAGKAFAIPHFDGYSAVLIQLRAVSGKALREAVTDGWLACAPPHLADRYLHR